MPDVRYPAYPKKGFYHTWNVPKVPRMHIFLNHLRQTFHETQSNVRVTAFFQPAYSR